MADEQQVAGSIPLTEAGNSSRKSEEHLEEKYRTILKTIEEGFCIYELIYDNNEKPIDLRWIEVNSAYEKQTGLKDTVGKLASDVMPGTENNWLYIYDRVAKTGEAVHFESWHQPTGRWYNTFSSRIGGAGSRQVAVLFSNVTQRKQQEERQAFLLKLSDTLRAETGVENVGSRAVKMMAEQLKADRVYLVTLTSGDDNVVVTHEVRREDMPPLRGCYRGSDFPSTIKEIFERTIVYNDVNTDARLTELDRLSFTGLGAVGFIAASIRRGGEDMIWAAGALTTQPRQWTETEIALFEDAVERTWAAVEKARVEEALRQSEEKYRKLFNSIDEGFHIMELIYDSNGKAVDYRYIETNHTFTKHTGLKNVAGKLGSETAPGIEDYWLETYAKVAETGEPVRIENYNEFTGRWYSAFSFRISDKRTQVAVLFNDITERKQRDLYQQYLLKLNDALRTSACSIEIEEKVTAFAMEYFNADRCYYCTIEGDDAVIRRDAKKQSLPSVAGSYPLSSFTLLKKVIDDGVPFVVHNAHTTPVLDEPLRELCLALQVVSFIDVPVMKMGKAAGVLCMVQSTPRRWTETEIQLAVETAERTWAAVERSNAEEALRDSEMQLRSLLKLRTDFISIASHELKTPVTSVKAYAEIVQERLEEIGNADDSDLLSKLNAQVDRLSILINTLLDTTKISEGQLQLSLKEIDINDLLTERVKEIKRTSNHNFYLQLQNVPLLMADRERVGQVVTNLLSNAIKYSPKGTTITVTSIAEPGWVKVSVYDEGYGIPEQDITKIFDRFFRVTANNMGTFPGMGLGLYISNQIVHKHGGTISVRSTEGKGSVFSFTLPFYNNHP